MKSTPRYPTATLPIHDISDGSSFADPFDPDIARQCPEADGINVLGTPMGSPDFIESYLFGKGIKHGQLLSFIQEVAFAGFPMEAVAMLTEAAGPRLTHLLKSVEKNPRTEPWMQEIDSASVETWLHCLTSSYILETAIDPTSMDNLTNWLDILPSYGGAGLNSLSRSVDEELFGSFADIAAYLIAFCRKTELPVYIGIAEALEAMGDAAVILEETDPPSPESPCKTLDVITVVSERAAELLGSQLILPKTMFLITTLINFDRTTVPVRL